MCEFRIGQKVVCVDADPQSGRVWNGDGPIEGAIYTIVGMMPIIASEASPRKDAVWLHLAEIRRAETARGTWGQYVGYGSHRFRPLVPDDSRYDISVFQRICSDISKRVSAE